MELQYQIGNNYVDISRNLIIVNKGSDLEQQITLPPKTLAVLTELAQRQGQVLSHESLMNSVWQDSVVSPNSLQRCITQLRKALGDDSKKQFFIKTHAKKGYSLELNVVFLSPTNENNVNALNEETSQASAISSGQLSKSQTFFFRSKNVMIVFFCLVILASFSYLSPTPRHFDFNTLTPLTATDAKEMNASFSPDGKFIIFHRFDGLCSNNIWAKEISTGKETQLTTQYGFYGAHHFTDKGDKIAFMAKEDCGSQKKIKQNLTELSLAGLSPKGLSLKALNLQKKNLEEQSKTCWNLMTLDYRLALKQPQAPVVAASCSQGELSDPVWLDNGNIAALKKENNHWQIVKFMPKAPIHTLLYADSEKNYYHLLYNKALDQLIAIGINSNDEHVIDLLNSKGKLLSSHIIIRPDTLPPFKLIHPIQDPQQQQLIFTTGKRLYSLSFVGKVEQVSRFNHNRISRINFSQDGESLVAVQGIIDTDIVKLSLMEITSTNHSSDSDEKPDSHDFNQVHQTYPSLARSTFQDRDAQFQPQGELIAFISSRSGTEQIWLKDKNEVSKLTNFAMGTAIDSFRWSETGESVLVVADSMLTKVLLDKTIINYPLTFAVPKLFHWSVENNILALIRKGGEQQLVFYNLETHKLTKHVSADIKWAAKANDGKIVYLDDDNVFWLIKGGEKQLITQLYQQVGSQRFIIKNDMIYSMNRKAKLWQYDIEGQVFTVIGQLDKYTNFVSDLRKDELLLTHILSAKKEIVMLSHKEE